MKRWLWLHSKVPGTDNTQKQTLETVARVKKVAPETLYKLPKLNACLYYLIDYYLSIASVSEVNFASIKNWSDLNRIELSHFEIQALVHITAIHNASRNE